MVKKIEAYVTSRGTIVQTKDGAACAEWKERLKAVWKDDIGSDEKLDLDLLWANLNHIVQIRDEVYGTIIE